MEHHRAYAELEMKNNAWNILTGWDFAQVPSLSGDED
jgi:hypothetical protein